MLKSHHNILTSKDRSYALIFTALGDETRLLLVAKLCEGQPLTISQLTEESNMTRQAIAKHLHVLMVAGIVRSTRIGRKHLFEFNPASFEEAHKYLAHVSKHWDQALNRLKSFVEKSP